MIRKLCLFTRRFVTFAVVSLCVQYAEARTVSPLLPVANTSTQEPPQASAISDLNYSPDSQGAIIWQENFEGALPGATSFGNHPVPGTVVETANWASSIVIDLNEPANTAIADAFIHGSGHVLLLSVGDNDYAAVRPNMDPITFPAVLDTDTFVFSFDMYIPTHLEEAVGGVNPRLKASDETSKGPVFRDHEQTNAGSYHIEYTGTVANWKTGTAPVDTARPFIGFDQKLSAEDDGTTTNVAYIDNIYFEISSASSTRTVSPLLPVANTSTHELARASVFCGTNFLVGIRGSATAGGEACAQLVSAAGVPIGSLIQTGRDVSVGGSMPSAPILAFGNGNVLMVWTDSASQHPASGDDIYGQFIDPSGTLLGGAFPVYAGSGSEMAVGVASDGVDFFVIWSDSSSGLWGRPVSSSGTLGSTELFSTTTIGHNASVAYGGGQYLVAWMEGPGPRYPVARRYSTAGVLSNPILLGTGSGSYNPVNVGYGDGHFLVGWHHRYSEEEDWNLRGRIVLPDGTLPGGELSLISSDSPEYALWQNITFDGDYFLLCWLQAESFAATGITYGQYFNSAGNLMGAPFEIDATSGGGFKIPGGASAHNGKALILITTDAMGSAGDVHAVLIDSSTHVDIHAVGAGQMQLEYKGILESATNLVSGSWEEFSPQPANPWNFTTLEESRYFRVRRLVETESTDNNLRVLLLGTWRVAADNNPSGMYFINTYRDVGTMSSEEHIPEYPVETYHGTFVVEGDKLYLDWGGGDTYTHIISIDGDTLSGMDMDGNTFTGIRQ